MQSSLCALLPVYNLEATAPSLAAECLEIVAELANDFQVLLVDDGSTDATAESAVELETRYPQLRVISHPARLGERAIWESALRESACDTFFYCDAAARADLLVITSMWPCIHSHDLVMARRRPASALGWIPKLPSRQKEPHMSADRLEWTNGECLLVRRTVIENWMNSARSEILASHLSRGSYSCRAVELPPAPAIGTARASTAAGQDRGFERSAPRHSGASAHRTQSGSRRQRSVAPPNSLAKLRDFALGE